MTTRLGVTTKQRMEYVSTEVVKLNSTPRVIRIIQALGAGDTSYFVKTNIRLRSGNIIKINFPMEKQSRMKTGT